MAERCARRFTRTTGGDEEEVDRVYQLTPRVPTRSSFVLSPWSSCASWWWWVGDVPRLAGTGAAGTWRAHGTASEADWPQSPDARADQQPNLPGRRDAHGYEPTRTDWR